MTCEEIFVKQIGVKNWMLLWLVVNSSILTPNYDLFKLACRVSAKRLFPNFSFIDAPYNLQYYKPGDYNTEIAYMGCRTRVIGNVYDPTREIVTGRGNLSFTSINLPRLGILAGGLFGALSVHIGGVPISLSTSGGALIAGLVFGWLRSKHPTFGRIPEPSQWVLNNVGLNMFIAVVGISAGPSFVQGFHDVGVSLFLIGAIATTLPLIIGLLLARYLFKFHPAIALGCCAGARTTTAALGAIQDAVESETPALGYTVTYAVGNTLLIIWGVVIVLLI